MERRNRRTEQKADAVRLARFCPRPRRFKPALFNRSAFRVWAFVPLTLTLSQCVAPQSEDDIREAFFARMRTDVVSGPAESGDPERETTASSVEEDDGIPTHSSERMSDAGVDNTPATIGITANAPNSKGQPTTIRPTPRPPFEATKAQREYAAIAQVASMPWVKGRDLYPKNQSPLIGFARALSEIGLDSRLAGSAVEFAAVGVVLEAGYRGPRAYEVASLDPDLLIEAFMTVYTGEVRISAGTVKDVLKNGIAGAVVNWLGDFVFARGIKLHEAYWQRSLLPEARRLAGGDDLSSAITCFLSLGTSEAKTGLRLKNNAGTHLNDVTIAVTSNLGGSTSPYGSYFVFVPQWTSGSSIYLPPSLIADALRGRPGVAIDRAVRVEMYCRSGSMSARIFGASDARYKKAVGSRTFDLQLR